MINCIVINCIVTVRKKNGQTIRYSALAPSTMGAAINAIEEHGAMAKIKVEALQ